MKWGRWSMRGEGERNRKDERGGSGVEGGLEGREAR
jgi:hypothetical protein